MLRYLEEERYSCTCDICGKAKHFYTNSKRKAMKNAWNLGYRFVVVNGVTYLYRFERSEREQIWKICDRKREEERKVSTRLAIKKCSVFLKYI